MPSRFFVTGTSTGIGKTVVSALLCAALDAVYWKPIQTGARDDSDRSTVLRLASLPRHRALPEAYRFSPPVSPHLAARRARVQIRLGRIRIPESVARENLIVEGAGGVLVPINADKLMLHLMSHLNLPVLLVTQTCLGTINHTLLSIFALRSARLDLRGVIMVGKPDRENRKAIEHYGRIRVIGELPPLKKINRAALLEAFRKHFDHRAFLA